MKSTTCPRANPGARNDRSTRCVTAPPNNNDNDTACTTDAGFNANRTNTTTATAVMIVKTHVEPAPIENAAPELYNNRNRRKSPNTDTGARPGNTDSAQNFVA